MAIDVAAVVTCDVVPTLLVALVNAAVELMFCIGAAVVVFDALIVVETVCSCVCVVAGVGVVEDGAGDITGWQGNGVARPDCDSRKG